MVCLLHHRYLPPFDHPTLRERHRHEERAATGGADAGGSYKRRGRSAPFPQFYRDCAGDDLALVVRARPRHIPRGTVSRVGSDRGYMPCSKEEEMQDGESPREHELGRSSLCRPLQHLRTRHRPSPRSLPAADAHQRAQGDAPGARLGGHPGPEVVTWIRGGDEAGRGEDFDREDQMVHFLIVLGLVASIFFGLACMSIHFHSKWHHQHGGTLPIRRWLVNEPTGTRYTMPHLIYQVWLNFVGAAAGWIAIIVLYQ